ncbi:hypothetical protein ACTMTI_38410 [Nonomuraea sp. H19]|uniref:hypothetical protein n=1 Tax=Nonomuraea sp. H19 TaxID=3452206 RepID=UPI003F89851A
MAITQPRGRAAAVSDGRGPKRLTLDLPMLSVEVRQPELRMPHLEANVPMPHVSRQELGHYVDIAKTFLPPPERIAYYGALGALAVFGAIDWPVAAAIGVGTIIAQRQRRQGQPMSSRPRETQAPAPSRGGTATTGGATAKPGTMAEPASGRKTTSGTTSTRKAAAEPTSTRKTTSGATAGTRKTTSEPTGKTRAAGTRKTAAETTGGTRKTASGSSRKTGTTESSRKTTSGTTTSKRK